MADVMILMVIGTHKPNSNMDRAPHLSKDKPLNRMARQPKAPMPIHTQRTVAIKTMWPCGMLPWLNNSKAKAKVSSRDHLEPHERPPELGHCDLDRLNRMARETGSMIHDCCYCVTLPSLAKGLGYAPDFTFVPLRHRKTFYCSSQPWRRACDPTSGSTFADDLISTPPHRPTLVAVVR